MAKDPAPPPVLRAWPLRVARQAAAAIRRRGGSVVIHAAIIGGNADDVPGFRTACGRWFPLTPAHTPDEVGGVSCVFCCRRLAAGAPDGRYTA